MDTFVPIIDTQSPLSTAHTAARVPASAGGRFFTTISILLGLLLLSAAGLKFFGLNVSALPSLGWFATPRVQVVTATWEIVLGLWLLSGCASRTGAWLAAVGTFLTFAGVSGFLGWSGVASCGCFGVVEASPWLAFALDVAALALLAVGRPDFRSAPIRLRSRLVTVSTGVLASIILLVLLFDEKAPSLFVLERMLDFGEVWEDAAFEWTLPIENRSPRDIRIEKMSASCTCVNISPRLLEIPAGQVREVVLTLDLTRNKDNKQSSLAARDFTVQVAAKLQETGGSELPISQWEVHGRIRQSLSFEPRSINFGHSIRRGSQMPAREVRVRAAIPLQELVAKVEPNLADVDVQPLSDGGTEFLVTIRPREIVGLLDFAIVLQPHAQNLVLPNIRIPAFGRVVEDVRAIPDVVHQGALIAGKVIEESVVLRSSNGVPFIVDGIEVSDPDVMVQSKKIESDVKEYRITTRASGTGNRKATVQFTIRQGQSPPIIVPVQINFFVLVGGG